MFKSLMQSGTVRTSVALALVGALAASALAAEGGKGGNDPTTTKSIVLGKTEHYPPPGCPAANSCEVIARVTGIQMIADGVQHPFRVPQDGQLVAWWLRLPTLHESQIKSFDNLFGGDPAARIAVLRRGIRQRFRLVRQGDTEPLKDKLGAKGRVRFRLTTPLPVKEGDYIGLTSVTWVPSFAVNLDAAGNSWLASRPRNRCTTPSSKNVKRFARYYKHSEAHLQSSTAKEYQCTYQTARLIYWARIVPNASPSPAPAKKLSENPGHA